MFYQDKKNKKLVVKSNKQKTKKKIKWNYSAKVYSDWRKKVYTRDLYRCRVCGVKTKLEAHHIKMKSKYPKLAFVVGNGITLCKHHHGIVTGHEEKWVLFFKKIVIYKKYDYSINLSEFEKWLKKIQG